MVLTPDEREELQSVILVGYDGSLSDRAQMVLWWHQGKSAAEIAGLAGTSKPTVYKWVERFDEDGLAALEDLKSTGRPRSVPGEVRSRILALTRMPPPPETRLSHWSSYEMAKFLKSEGISVSHNFVAQLWREHDLKPHLQGTFKLSKDPNFAAKVVDVIGLYLSPPEGAIVFSFDEKTQVQALDRTQPVLPIDFGVSKKRTHDYVRHGTTNLFAALNVLNGKIIAKCFSRKRTTEVLKFLTGVVGRYPRSM